MKKRKIYFLISLIILLLVFGIMFCYKNYKIKQESYNKRYNEMKQDISKFLENYFSIVAPYCQKGSSHIITHQTLVYFAGMDKDKLLDVDEKSYCQVYVTSECIESGDYFNNIRGKMNWEINLKCKYIKDKHFKKWDEPFESKK